jgi:hypothetical protein
MFASLLGFIYWVFSWSFKRNKLLRQTNKNNQAKKKRCVQINLDEHHRRNCQELKLRTKFKPKFDSVTVLFAGRKGLQAYSEQLSPEALVGKL